MEVLALGSSSTLTDSQTNTGGVLGAGSSNPPTPTPTSDTGVSNGAAVFFIVVVVLLVLAGGLYAFFTGRRNSNQL